MSAAYDSIIFDMDGTMWDAVDTYAFIWNTVFSRLGLPPTVTREQLISLMGKPIDVIVRAICGPLAQNDLDRIQEAILSSEGEITVKMGGELYPGVRETLPVLADDYKLFMVSNCGPEGLHNFLKFTGLGEYITDTLTHGETGLPKEGNIRLLIERYTLENPIYVGDVQSDSDSAHRAGIDMAWAEYGFGKVDDAEINIKTFSDLPRALAEVTRNTSES